MNKIKILFLFVFLQLTASDIESRRQSFENAIDQIAPGLDADMTTRLSELREFVTTSLLVEKERLANQRSKKNPNPVKHSKDLVLLNARGYQGTTMINHFVENLKLSNDLIFPLFKELQKATELSYQECACHQRLEGLNSAPVAALWKKYDSLKTISVEMFESVGRGTRKIHYSYEIFMRTPYGILSAISEPGVYSPIKKIDERDRKRQDHFEYVIRKTPILFDGQFGIHETLINVKNNSIVSIPGILFEIISTDAKSVAKNEPLPQGTNFLITIQAFDLKEYLTSSHLTLYAFPKITELTAENPKLQFAVFNKITCAMRNANFLPQSVHPLIAHFLLSAIEKDQQDFFLPLLIQDDDLPLLILDTVKEAIELKKKKAKLTEEEINIVQFAEDTATQLNMTLEQFEKNLEQEYLKKIKEEQVAVSARVIEDVASISKPQHNKNFKPAVCKKKNKKDDDDDALLDQMMQVNEKEKEDLQTKELIQNKMASYLGDGKRVLYRNLIRMINFAKKSGALQDDAPSFQSGSHRRQEGISMVVAHGNQSETSLMAKSGRMVQSLLNGLLKKLEPQVQ